MTRVYAQHQTLATIDDSAETDKKEIRLALFIELFMRGPDFCPHDSHTRSRTHAHTRHNRVAFIEIFILVFRSHSHLNIIFVHQHSSVRYERPGAVVVVAAVVMCGCVSSFDFASIILLFFFFWNYNRFIFKNIFSVGNRKQQRAETAAVHMWINVDVCLCVRCVLKCALTISWRFYIYKFNDVAISFFYFLFALRSRRTICHSICLASFWKV